MDVSVYSAPWGKTSIHLFSEHLPNVFFVLSTVPGPALEQTSCPPETYHQARPLNLSCRRSGQLPQNCRNLFQMHTWHIREFKQSYNKDGNEAILVLHCSAKVFSLIKFVGNECWYCWRQQHSVREFSDFVEGLRTASFVLNFFF